VKKAIVFVVFLFILKPIFPVIEYILNYDYISKELCENKAKPEMSCNGKCHLMKELAKVSENDNPVTQDKKNTSTLFEVLFFQKLEKISFSNFTFSNSKRINTNYCNLYSHNYSFSFFHPPIV
jgi:hypothetical protein